MRRRLAILNAADMQRSGAAELDLRPFQIANLACPQPVPISNEDKRGVAVTVAPVASSLGQLLDLGRGQILTRSQLAIGGPGTAPVLTGFRYLA
jgi:hypothetical protein